MLTICWFSWFLALQWQYLLLTVPRGCFFCGSFLLVMLHVGVCCVVISVPCSLVVTCWKRTDLLAVVFKLLCFVTFPNVFWSTLELRVRLAPWNWFKPSSKIFLLTFQGGTSLVDHLCFAFVMFSRLFIAALLSPAGKGLTSWLLFVMSSCDFVTFPNGILGQLWYLIVLIPDLCHLSYFLQNFTVDYIFNQIYLN